MSYDKVLEELRLERQQRYKQLSEGERPRIVPCPDCGEPPHIKEICPATGIVHNREKRRIVGGAVVNSNMIRSSELMEAIDRSRVRWVQSRTRLVRTDVTSLNVFESFVRQCNWSLQRYGVLYGTYNATTFTIEVHAIYEPEQEGNTQTFTVLQDDRIATVDLVAKQLGLRRVGVVCTHGPRDTSEMALSARELLLCAREQSRFGDECVILTVSPNVTTGRTECQAWQASPQAVHLYSLGLLAENPVADVKDDNRGETSEAGTSGSTAAASGATGRFVYSSIPLEVAQEQRDASGHPQVVTKAPSHKGRNLLVYRLHRRAVISPVVRNSFVRISRPGMSPPTRENLRTYLEDPKRKGMKMLQRLADFHVLVFLACNIFSVDKEVKVIINAIRGECPEEDAAPHEATIRALIECSSSRGGRGLY
uniref:Nuclear pore localisation protein NPL4 C-terminal domain-containing protein n=1 Tax=Trypanosoma congolense (strain IL3000) TaxID=1068625 RepID=G0UJT0_TRYCI|nr:conserved hypothetical protein [Trypanosoma congolense IL3000]